MKDVLQILGFIVVMVFVLILVVPPGYEDAVSLGFKILLGVLTAAYAIKFVARLSRKEDTRPSLEQADADVAEGKRVLAEWKARNPELAARIEAELMEADHENDAADRG